MYKDEISVIFINGNQLSNIVSSIYNMISGMGQFTEQDEIDVSSLKAYIASIDIQMISLNSQQTLLQQALDDLASKLAG